MELQPSEILQMQIKEKETNLVKAYQDSMTSSEHNAIKKQSQRLKEIQDNDDPPSVVNTIPSLELKDIDKQGVEHDIDVVEEAYGSAVTMYKSTVEASAGIVYIDVGIDISSLPYGNIEILPLIESMLSETDTEENTRAEIDNLIAMHTGGISIDLKLIPIYDEDYREYIVMENKKMHSFLFFRRCVAENAEIMLGLIKKIAQTSIVLSQEKVVQILERKISSYESAIPSSGHSYAATKIHGKYDVQSFFEKKLYGISQLQSLKKLLKKANDNGEDFVPKSLVIPYCRLTTGLWPTPHQKEHHNHSWSTHSFCTQLRIRFIRFLLKLKNTYKPWSLV